MVALRNHSDAAFLAELLAPHAVLLLGLGLIAIASAVLAVVVAVRAFLLLLPWLWRQLESRLSGTSESVTIGERLIAARPRVVSAYLVLHLGLGLAFAAAVTAFAVVAEDVVTNGEMAVFDVLFAQALRRTVTPEWERFFSLISRLGEPEALFIASIAVAAALLAKQMAAMATGWLLAQGGSGVLILALKNVLMRTRPEFADQALAGGWSFPSGHGPWARSSSWVSDVTCCFGRSSRGPFSSSRSRCRCSGAC